MFRKIVNIICGMLFTILLISNNAEASEYGIHVVDAETGNNVMYNNNFDDTEEFTNEPCIPMHLLQSTQIQNGDSSINGVIGTDDRQLITNTSVFPYTAMARITVQYQDGTVACGSGAMIAPRLFATAGHVLINENNSFPQSITIEFGLYGNNVFYTTTSYSNIIYYGNYQGYAPEHDYGFVVLSTNVGTTVTGHLGWANAVDVGQAIIAAGYPGGNPYLYSGTGNIISYTADLIYHNADMTQGQSGGPIYLNYEGIPYLKAVISGSAGNQNVGRRFDYGLYEWLNNNGYMS